MGNESTGSNRPRDRRQFFQHGLLRILTPLADMLQERLPALMPREHLRPPGALPEAVFLEKCYRCGNCVEICPASAIRRLSSDDPQQHNTPYIDPDLGACIVCENLDCMRVCPSGALVMVESRLDIRMGIARPRHEACLRSRGEDCTLCIERCPIGRAAIGLDEAGRVDVRSAGCVGCGVCQHLCPATPKAITIDPA